MSKSNSAILVVEFQKTWTEKSLFHKLIKKELESRNVVSNTMNFLNSAREKGVKIIQSPFIIDKNDKHKYKKMPIQPKILGQFKAGTWRAEYTDGIYNLTDLEVVGRTAFDNTINSNLLDLLKSNKIDKVYFIGFTTDHCVAETMDSLSKLGFKTILVSDCTAAMSNKIQKKMENKYLSMTYSKVLEKL